MMIVNEKIGRYTEDEILEHLTEGEGRGFLGRSMYDAIFDKIHALKTENEQLKQENARLKEENQALLTLVNWFEECGMGFDNIAQNDIINWEKFEEETEDMGYVESMIYYAKKYNEKQNLKEN